MRFNRLLNLTNLLLEETIDHVVPLLQKELLGDKSWKDLTPERQGNVQEVLNYRKSELKKQVEGLTGNPTYQSWIYRMLTGRKLTFPEDASKTHEVLKKFDKIKNSGNFKSNKDIMSYSSFGDLHTTVSEFEYGKATYKTGNYNGNTVVAERHGWKAVSLDDYEKAKPLLAKTGWCVREKQWWDTYEKPYYLISKDDVIKLLVHFPSAQMKDVHDDPVVSYDVKTESVNDKRKTDPSLDDDALADLIGNLCQDVGFEMNDIYGDFIWLLAPNEGAGYALAAARDHPDGAESAMAVMAHVVDDPDVEMMAAIGRYNASSKVMLNKGIIPTEEQQKEICKVSPDCAALAYALLEHGDEVSLEMLMSYAWYSPSSFASQYQKIGDKAFNATLDKIIAGHKIHKTGALHMRDELGKYMMILSTRLKDFKMSDKAVDISPSSPYLCLDMNLAYPPISSMVKAVNQMPAYMIANNLEGPAIGEKAERKIYDLVWMAVKKAHDAIKDREFLKAISKYPRVMEYLKGEAGDNEYNYMSSSSDKYPF